MYTVEKFNSFAVENMCKSTIWKSLIGKIIRTKRDVSRHYASRGQSDLSEYSWNCWISYFRKHLKSNSSLKLASAVDKKLWTNKATWKNLNRNILSYEKAVKRCFLTFSLIWRVKGSMFLAETPFVENMYSYKNFEKYFFTFFHFLLFKVTLLCFSSSIQQLLWSSGPILYTKLNFAFD